MYYFTSDLHFGHENLVKQRPQFSSVEEMDRVLIENWNNTVTNNDVVVVTGDMFFRNQTPCYFYLQKLKGKKILVKGNHDASWLKKFTDENISKFFEEIVEHRSFKQNKCRIWTCHYPVLCWDSSLHGDFLVCGHIHNKNSGYEYEMFKHAGNLFNAGVDINDFKPVTLRELIINNEKFYNRNYTPENWEVFNQFITAFEK